MIKFLNKWVRKFHRWIAVPTALLIFFSIAVKFIGNPELAAAWDRYNKLPSILMLVMAISGSYLFLIPYYVKWRRNQTRDTGEQAVPQPTVE